jgi:hypothetical protein
MGAHLSFQYNDHGDIPGLLDMVRRGCERLYALNHADKPGLFKANKYARMTSCQRDEAILLGMDGALSVSAIATMIGHTPIAVRMLFFRNGLKGKEARGGNRKKGSGKKKATP